MSYYTSIHKRRYKKVQKMTKKGRERAQLPFSGIIERAHHALRISLSPPFTHGDLIVMPDDVSALANGEVAEVVVIRPLEKQAPRLSFAGTARLFRREDRVTFRIMGNSYIVSGTEMLEVIMGVRAVAGLSQLPHSSIIDADRNLMRSI